MKKAAKKTAKKGVKVVPKRAAKPKLIPKPLTASKPKAPARTAVRFLRQATVGKDIFNRDQVATFSGLTADSLVSSGIAVLEADK